MPDTPSARLIARLTEAGLPQRDIADLLGQDRSLVSHWSGGRRAMPLDVLGRLGRELTRRWPDRRQLWAEVLLGDLARALGYRLVPDDNAPRPAGRLLFLDEEQRRQLSHAARLIARLDTP